MHHSLLLKGQESHRSLRVPMLTAVHSLDHGTIKEGDLIC